MHGNRRYCAIVTNHTELALLSLAAIKPLVDLPSFHLAIVDRLEAKGLMRLQNDCWHPTAAGLRLIQYDLH